MSGSGGYYRYHCKNWMTYDCQNWVWMNNTPCANCVAEGRDAGDNVMVKWADATWDARAPLIEDGEVRYLTSKELATMEMNLIPTAEVSGPNGGTEPTARPS